MRNYKGFVDGAVRFELEVSSARAVFVLSLQTDLSPSKIHTCNFKEEAKDLLAYLTFLVMASNFDFWPHSSFHTIST